MQKIGLFYGSTDGHTTEMATRILDEFQSRELAVVETYDVAEFYLDEMLAYDYLILGIPTWDTGQLQRDWEEVFDEFDALDLSGKMVAVFGLGDQHDYANTFVDAIFFVADKVRERGATLVGTWPTLGYDYERSWAIENDHFLGLVLDEVNQPEQSDLRIRVWVQQLAVEFQLV